MGKKKRVVEENIKPDSVLAKPMSQEEKEMLLKKKHANVMKTVITVVVILALAVGTTVATVVFKPWQYLPNSPTLVVKKYISALNDRNYEGVSKCLSPEMLKLTESNRESLGSEEALFDAVFNDDLKKQFGDDVAFSVNNFVKEEQKLEDGVYKGENVTELYGITNVVIITCDIVTTGSLSSESTPTYIDCVKIDGVWYINSMSE